MTHQHTDTHTDTHTHTHTSTDTDTHTDTHTHTQTHADTRRHTHTHIRVCGAGDLIKADEAKAMGLASKVFSPDDLMPETLKVRAVVVALWWLCGADGQKSVWRPRQERPEGV